MITYKHLPHHKKTLGANLGFQENDEFPMDCQLTDVVGVCSDNSEHAHTLGQCEYRGVLSQSSHLVYTGNPIRTGPLTLQTMGGV